MRRIFAIVIAIYLLLVLIDRFVLVELLFQRVAIPVLFAIAAALACIGTGFLARRGRRDFAVNLLVGYPIFGTICFLVGLFKISPWTMVPVVGILGGVGAISVGTVFRPPGGLKPAATLVLVLIAISAFIAAQAPPSTLDDPACPDSPAPPTSPPDPVAPFVPA